MDSTSSSSGEKHNIFTRISRYVITKICSSAIRHPVIILLLTVIVTVPAAVHLKNIRLETNLIRLLPSHSRAASLTRELKDIVSDGGYFTVLCEGGDAIQLGKAHLFMVDQIQTLPGIRSLDYQWPLEFLKKYRYLLIPVDYLKRISRELTKWEAEVNPFVENLEDDETFADREEGKDLDILLQQYSHLSRYHQSVDGKVRGILVRTSQGVTSLGKIRKLFSQLEEIAEDAEKKFGVWAGVGGSHRNKLNEYDLITADLNRSGLIASLLILMILLISFRSLAVVVLVLLPLGVGLIWAFTLVPFTVGSLNLITAFLLLILFGMGVDYSIHLVKRFQMEIGLKSLSEAMTETYTSTGSSVLISGLTTALALCVLIISDFRGFSEFGLICATAVGMVLLAMFMVLPAAMVLAHRLKWLKPRTMLLKKVFLANRPFTFVLLLMTVAASYLLIFDLDFDYNFRNLQFSPSTFTQSMAVKQRQSKVYSGSMSPGAIYLADSLSAMDSLTEVLAASKAAKGDKTNLGRVRSLRDFAPTDKELQARISLIKEIKGQVQGRWVEKIDDEEKKHLIKDFRDWRILARGPAISEVPQFFRNGYTAKDGSGRLLLTIHPRFDRKDGRNAMAFTQELYDLNLPQGIRGPIGETAVFAETLWVVTGEGLWLTLLTVLGVLVLVWLNRGSLKDALWILFPLTAGVVLTFGIMAVLGLKLNFFNVVVIPALFGMGVDLGVHYYRRCMELGGDTAATLRELFEPLSITTVTTMLGYSGMVFARHPGIQSIGILACLGLSLIWMTSLLMLPGMLDWIRKKGQRQE